MKRLVVPMTAIICSAVCVYPSYAATLDQFQTASNSSSVGFKGGAFRRAQTFTAGLNGELDRVEVLIGQFTSLPPAGNPVMSLYSAPAGIPLTWLGSVSTDKNLVPVDNDIYLGNYVSFDIKPLHLQVHTGDVVAIAMDTAVFGDLYSWEGSQNDPYPHGAALSQFGSGPWTPDSLIYSLGELDRAFKTYVNVVPEPTAAGLLLGSLVAGAFVRVRVRRRVLLREGMQSNEETYCDLKD